MGGWWLLMPIVGVLFMVVMMRGMCGMSRRGRGGGGMCMGHGDHDGHNGHKGGEFESAVDVLRRRNAVAELSDAELASSRSKL